MLQDAKNFIKKVEERREQEKIIIREALQDALRIMTAAISYNGGQVFKGAAAIS